MSTVSKSFPTFEAADFERKRAMVETMDALQELSGMEGLDLQVQLDGPKDAVRVRRAAYLPQVSADLVWHMMLAFKIQSPPEDAEGKIDQQNALVAKATAPAQQLGELVKLSKVYKAEHKQEHILQLEASITVIETRALGNGEVQVFNHGDATMGDRPTKDQLLHLGFAWLTRIPSMLAQD